MGDDFYFDYKYCTMLTILCTCLTYSSGMPSLYFVAAIFFIITYWFDKILLLRCNKKPPNYDDHMAKQTVGWFKFAITLHVIGFLFMYGYTPIL